MLASPSGSTPVGARVDKFLDVFPTILTRLGFLTSLQHFEAAQSVPASLDIIVLREEV